MFSEQVWNVYNIYVVTYVLKSDNYVNLLFCELYLKK